MRRFLYALAKLLGDVNAVNKGKVGRRAGRRAAGNIRKKNAGQERAYNNNIYYNKEIRENYYD